MLSHSQDTPPARHHSLENAEGEWEQSLRMCSYPTQQAALLLFFGMVSALSVLWEPKVEALAPRLGKKPVRLVSGLQPLSPSLAPALFRPLVLFRQ